MSSLASQSRFRYPASRSVGAGRVRKGRGKLPHNYFLFCEEDGVFGFGEGGREMSSIEAMRLALIFRDNM